jgi:uncharacterized membrane protein YbhN (UPF0104 family)
MMSAPPTPPEPTSRHLGRQILTWTLKVIVSGGLLYWLLTGKDIDRAQLFAIVKSASFAWLAFALGLYVVVILIGTWRWRVLLAAQHLDMSFKSLTGSYLVASFFNNFLPSNIGGDVVRIRDTAKAAKSTTLAGMIVIVARGVGLVGLGFVAACGASVTAWMSPTVGPVGPGILWAGLLTAVAAAGWAVWMPHGVGALLKPLRALHQEWVGERIEQLMDALHRFRSAPQALLAGLAASILVQGILVGFYAAIAYGLHQSIPLASLAVVVPISFIVQMLPVSVNGLGIREGTFVAYLKLFGVARQSALALSLTSWVVILVFSLSGAVAYLTRRH